MSEYQIAKLLDVEHFTSAVLQYKNQQESNGRTVQKIVLNEKVASELVGIAQDGTSVVVRPYGKDKKLTCFVHGVMVVPTSKLDDRHPLFLLKVENGEGKRS